MDMAHIINQMLVLLILLIVGVIACKTGITDEVSNQRLTKIVIHIAQTACTLGSVMNVESSFTGMELLILVGVSCLTYVLLIVIAFFVPRILRVPRADWGLYSFMTIFGNVGFMGFPVIASIFGQEAVFYAALCNIPFSILAFSLGIALVTGHGGKLKIDFKQVINAPFLATFVAIAIFALDIRVPEALADAVTRTGDMIIPLAMLIIGGSLGNMKLKDIFCEWRTYVFAVIRLILLPILVWAILRLFVTNEMMLGIVTVITAMPVAAIATMFSIEYGGNEAVASRTVVLTTVLSVFTIPLVVYLLLV
jgi:predicted permease